MLIIKDRYDNRAADRELIERGLKSRDPNDRRQAEIAKYTLDRESKKVASMREALVKAHRNKDKAEIADIHDFIERHPEYKRVRG